MHQLTEYFDAVISAEDESSAARIAVEHVMEALGGEFGALMRADEVVTCVGVGRAAPPTDAIAEAIAGSLVVDIPSIGLINAATAGLDGEDSAHLIIGRIDEAFTAEERQLMLGMASVLGLALHSLHTLHTERMVRLEREREASERLQLLDNLGRRQRLLESILTIQRAISHREPLQSVLEAVTSGAARLLEDAYVALVLTDGNNNRNRVVSVTGPDGDLANHHQLVLQAASDSREIDGPITCWGVGDLAALAAPVHIEGIKTGCLVTVLHADGTDLEDRAEMLAAFAEQASLALTDARTLDAMRDAYQDSLTGLPNRELFLESLNRALQRSARLDTEVTVLFIDLDGFKDVNDNMGHAVGDALLAAVGGRIRDALRGADMAARLGGDEFAVLLEGTTGYDAGRLVADRITAAMREPIVLADRELFAFASIGIASSDKVTTTADQVLRNADFAMYSAKRSGSRTALLYEPRMHAESSHELELRSDLSSAVRRGELRLQYQPLVDLQTGSAVGVEALLRWDHPRFGTVPPNIFIPIAERMGSIVEIGEWVLKSSLEQVYAWQNAGLPDLKLSVNVSARQLDEASFPDVVAGLLRRTGLPAHALTLEITESSLMRDADGTLERLAPLKALGVRLAIDDFGTGYSSLAWLQHFPADQLKIDKAFIDSIETSTDGAAIVRAIVELAHTLRLETVAEGIETLRQWRSLQELGCGLGQGYYFSRPLAIDAVLPFFASTPSVVAAGA